MRYREQYDRMRRWYERFRAIAVFPSLDRSVAEMTDEVFAFFESCLHLREWIRYDNSLPESVRLAAREYVKTNRALALCRYIAVGSKHLTVERPVSDEKATIKTRRATETRPYYPGDDDDDDGFALPPGTPIHTVVVRFHVETDAGQMDAFELATACVAAWDEFLAAHRL
jgi:hypothetical protein